MSTALKDPPTAAGIHHTTPRAARLLAAEIDRLWPVGRPVCVVCVGTDRSTGDSFGPLVGTLLQSSGGGVRVKGTLDRPVGAKDLDETRASIPLGAWTLAVDSGLGSLDRVGFLSVCPEPLKPGAGLGKDLAPIGDARLIGTVNVGGFLDYFVLQNTRLGLVLAMARVAAEAIGIAVARRGAWAEAAAAGGVEG